MQELLARLKALDPNASLALRIIACFDELVRGGVNIHGLLGAAASLAGCVAGYAGQPSARTMRVAPSGEILNRPLKYQSTPPVASASMATLIDER